MSLAFRLLEKGLLPDAVVRMGIRRLLKQRLEQLTEGGPAAQQQRYRDYVAMLKASPIAVATDAANEQHYEVPTEFYEHILGPAMKYSSCYWPAGCGALAEAETSMLDLTLQRADVQNGMRVLDLGCGWGALTLHTAAAFPKCQVVGFSNSRTQRDSILARAKERGLHNVEIVTGNASEGEIPQGPFDRILSVEMLEHMRNYARVFEELARRLTPDGKVFIHVFTHRNHPYLFEVQDESDWMSRYFFTGGQMPSEDLFANFSQDLRIVKQWRVNGVHYQKTLEAWLQLMDARKAAVMPILAKAYAGKSVVKWWTYWRVFLMSCSELFGYNGGDQWFVSHYLFEKQTRNTTSANPS